MANVNQPRGFFPVRHLLGAQIESKKYILTTGATVYRGDLLKAVAAGTVQAASAGDGTIVVGVAAEYKSDAASAGGVEVLVYDDPYIVFGVQADGSVAAADVFNTANHTAGSGNATTKVSGHQLNAANIGTGSQLKIIGKIDEPNNNWEAYVDLEVLINQHQYKASVAGV